MVYSITEGRRSPKVPLMFRSADLVLVTGSTCLAHLDFDLEQFLGYRFGQPGVRTHTRGAPARAMEWTSGAPGWRDEGPFVANDVEQLSGDPCQRSPSPPCRPRLDFVLSFHYHSRRDIGGCGEERNLVSSSDLAGGEGCGHAGCVAFIVLSFVAW